MDKVTFLALLVANKKFFVLIFCVLFGVVSGESYNVLKDSNRPKFKNILPRVIVALFVCSITTPVIDYFTLLNRYYPYCIITISCVAMQLMDWFIVDLLPATLSIFKEIIIKVVTKEKKKLK